MLKLSGNSDKIVFTMNSSFINFAPYEDFFPLKLGFKRKRKHEEAIHLLGFSDRIQRIENTGQKS